MNIRGYKERESSERADIVCLYVVDFDPSKQSVDFCYQWLEDRMRDVVQRIGDDKC